MADNTQGERCDRCRWFETIEKSTGGKCLVKPPVCMLMPVRGMMQVPGRPGQMQETEALQLQSVWPVVPATARCAEFRAKVLDS